MKLKEGMYVRTKLNDFCNLIAIRKIEEIDEDDNKFWIDDYIIDTYGDEQNKLCDEDVEKASNNIIDLIEEGDYVNGVEVIGKEFDNFNKEYLQCGVGDYVVCTFEVKDIKTILTKEQFENMMYIVESE